MAYKYRFLVLNGPNLNLLGSREQDKYGIIKLSDFVEKLIKYADKLSVQLTHFQSNAEFQIIDRIHASRECVEYIIINPAALAHTSVALRDAFLATNIPFIEVHISNIYAREPFRKYSYLSDISSGVICGFGIDGYTFALKMAVKRLSNIN